MTLNGTLTLNTVIAKTAKRLYAIRYVVEAHRVMPEDMFKVYTYNIRSV